MSRPEPPPLGAEVAATLGLARQLVEWIADRQHDQDTPPGRANLLASMLLDVCLEHHTGIVWLIRARVYGSAFALVRSELEAFVRAVWVHTSVPEARAEELVDKDNWPQFDQLIEAVERHADFADKVLSGVRQSAWTAMNGYAHGGMHQISRRFRGDTIEPNYEPGEVIEVLKATGSIALMALLQIARRSGDQNLEQEVAAMLAGHGASL